MNVLTLGTFDIPHAGHLHFLKQCDQFGTVTIGLNSDEFIEAYKGFKPVFNYSERKALLELFGYRVVKNNSAGKQLILQLCPDMLVIGSDWAKKDYYAQIGLTQEILDDYGIIMTYIPYTKGISATEIKRRVGD